MMRTIYGRTNSLPPRPMPGSDLRYVTQVVETHVRLPHLYTFASWLGLHRLATRLLVWHSFGYTSARLRR